MKRNPLLSRRIAVAAAVLALAGAMVVVALRTGPLAPVQVTLSRVVSGTLSPSVFGIGSVSADMRRWRQPA